MRNLSLAPHAKSPVLAEPARYAGVSENRAILAPETEQPRLRSPSFLSEDADTAPPRLNYLLAERLAMPAALPDGLRSPAAR
jgi:hypothetical protein